MKEGFEPCVLGDWEQGYGKISLFLFRNFISPSVLKWMLRARVAQARNTWSITGLSGTEDGVIGDNPPSLWAKMLIISYWLQAIGVHIHNNEIDTWYLIPVSDYGILFS